MINDKAYQQAENKIEEVLRKGYKEIKITNLGITEIPNALWQIEDLQLLDLSENKLTALPDSLKRLTQLRMLNLSKNDLTELPDWISQLQSLEALILSGNKIGALPISMKQFVNLRKLDLSENILSELPTWLGDLQRLQYFSASANQIVAIPKSIRNLTQLRSLYLHQNQINEIPNELEYLNELNVFSLSENQIKVLPEFLGNFTHITSLDLHANNFTELPDTLKNLTQLSLLNLSNNPLRIIPEWVGNLRNLKVLNLNETAINDIPPSILELESLQTLNLDKSPLNSELEASYKQGFNAVKAYLRAKTEAHIVLRESKLILIGEGEVGKTCLTDALLDSPWEEHPSTHGIQIKPIKLTSPDSQTEITLNAWDFGGQRVYRPTHQLFFSAPAVYLVVWKPREGSQAGQVKEWIQLVKRREPSAKILVVATHGGPQQRQPDIDRQELWDLFGKETVVDFFFVESKPDAQGNRKGIDELKRAIAQVAAGLPEVGRSVPKSFADVRQALQETGKAYLPLRDVLDICRAHNMDDEIARLFITISHRLGHLTHYENDPTLRDIVILRPDWLATAMSYVLDDEETRAKHGLVNFSRLSHLWDDETRAADSRYEKNLHPIFLRLMERFDLSYRVADPTSRSDSDPVSLIGQLVPDIRPQNLSTAWESSPASGDIQQTQICHIVDASNGQSASAEGLFYQLIVRLHKYSLGRVDYKDSVHWQRGLVLEDEYKSRAFLEHVGNDVRITVRSPYPEGLLGMLTREVKFLVESFWEGLRCDVMVPCIEPCGKHAAGTGLFEVEKLMDSKRKNRHEFPCPVCTEWQNIDALLRNAPAATQAISLADLQSEFASLKSDLRNDMNANTRRILSQVDKTYTDLLQVLTDEAKEGPRLFSLFPLDGNQFNPQTWVREKFRLVLWCEHSRLPLPVHNNWDMNKGVYDFELDREWFKRAVPFLKFMTGTLSLVLPIMSSTLKVVDDTAFKKLENDISLGKNVIDFFSGEGAALKEVMGAADTTNPEKGVGIRAENATLRELHAMLKAKDPGFGGLVRVMNKRQEFLWVHEKFAGEY